MWSSLKREEIGKKGGENEKKEREEEWGGGREGRREGEREMSERRERVERGRRGGRWGRGEEGGKVKEEGGIKRAFLNNMLWHHHTCEDNEVGMRVKFLDCCCDQL